MPCKCAKKVILSRSARIPANLVSVWVPHSVPQGGVCRTTTRDKNAWDQDAKDTPRPAGRSVAPGWAIWCAPVNSSKVCTQSTMLDVTQFLKRVMSGRTSVKGHLSEPSGISDCWSASAVSSTFPNESRADRSEASAGRSGLNTLGVPTRCER